MTPPPDDRDANKPLFAPVYLRFLRGQQTGRARGRAAALKLLFVFLVVPVLLFAFSLKGRAQDSGFAAMAEKLIGTGGEWGQTIDLNDPCPVAGQDSAAPPPDDLTTLQADIDRFTLCAERAEMLKRLNGATLDKDTESEEKADTSLENPGFRLRTPTAGKKKQPPVPPVSEEALTSPPGESSGSAPAEGEWAIVNIFGAGQGLQVRLRKDDGSVAQAKTGTVLADGWTVKQVSTAGVTLTKGGQDKLLTWMD